MVERNLTVPHRFVCVTDDSIDGVETLELDGSKHVPGTVFLRLMQHRRDYGELIKANKVLNLDIDVVITGNLDHIANRAEDFVIWRNPNFAEQGTAQNPWGQRAFYQSSVQLFVPGARPQLYEDFDPVKTPKWVNWRFGGREQAWISERLSWDEPHFSERDGVYGAGRLGGKGVYSELPDNASIVSMPGARAPWQEEAKQNHPWIERYWK